MEETEKIKSKELGFILDEAKTIINGQRKNDYGQPEDSFAIIASLWNAYLNDRLRSRLLSYDVALLMSLMKIGRIAAGLKKQSDSYIDACGYIALAHDIIKGQSNGQSK